MDHNIEELPPAQIDDGDNWHDGMEGPQPRVEPNVQTTQVENTKTQPVRNKKPNMRYPATEFDLNSVRLKSRRTPRMVN